MATSKPSPAQIKYLTDLRNAGADVDPVHRYELPNQPALGTELAARDRGWVTVDRGTPDNRGGLPYQYKHTLTAAGLAALKNATR